MNTAGLEPRGHAVLVKPYEMKTDLVQLPSNVRDRADMIEQRAVVIAVGPMAWKDETEPRAQPGDHVLISKYAGHIAQGLDEQSYRFINANDIFARFTEAQNG